MDRTRPPTRRSLWADRIRQHTGEYAINLAAWSIPITASSAPHLHGELTRKVEHFRYRKAPLLDDAASKMAGAFTRDAATRWARRATSAKNVNIFF